MSTTIPPQYAGPPPAGTDDVTGKEVVETPAVALSIQNQVARLGMVQANATKVAAAEKMQELQKTQEELNAIRKSLATAEKIKNGGDVYKRDFDDLSSTMKKYGVDISNVEFKSSRPEEKDYVRDKNKVELLMRQISSVQEEITAKMQTLMTQLQDFMGQYQSFLDGANTASSKANEIMLKLSR